MKNRAVFEDRLAAGLKKAGLKPKKPLLKAILDALSERDESADPIVAEEVDPKRKAAASSVSKTPRFGVFPIGAHLVRYESDNDLKDFENVPLGTDIGDYFEREVLPHAPDAWINPDFADELDHQVGKVGYEINFNRHFYTYQPPRPVAAIDSDIRKVEKNILAMLKEVMA